MDRRYFLGITAFLILSALPAPCAEEKAEQDKFEILENCSLVANPANDGDSFHVSHEGREWFFRLYFVDSPESDEHLEDRLKEQGEVFGLKPEDVLKAGKKAKKFTAESLGRGKFTIYTKWKDAKGASGMKRYFAFIRKGKEDYAEILVENGWARVYGASDVTPEGKSVNETYGKLKALQRKAKAGHKGAWTSKNAKDSPEDSPTSG